MRVEEQKAHTARIIRCARDGFSGPAGVPSRIRDSWRRSIDLYGMDPTRPVEAPVLTDAELRERKARNEVFIRVSDPYIGSLHRDFARLNYCILLTDGQGATLEMRNGAIGGGELGRMHLTPGACWSEQCVGTGGIGTAIHDHAPTLIYKKEHFSTRIIDMSCSAAPVFSPDGDLAGVLNVTGLNRDSDRRDQRLICNLIAQTATMIENAWFLIHNQDSWILEVNDVPGLFSNSSDQLISFDDSGRVVAGNRAARQALLQPNDERLPRSLDRVLHQNAEQLIDAARAQPGGIQTLTSSRVNAGARYYGRIRAPQRNRARHDTRAIKPARRSDKTWRGLASVESSDPRIATSVDRIRRVMDRGLPILLCGETGSGKERFARAVHEESERREAPFVAINCAAIPETLIESELFGYRGGAFTGAKSKGEKGKIMQANGGTLFLDEIGDMPAPLQTRLLRVLSEGEVLPLGSTDVEHVDISVICATHRDLPALVSEGRFREDLFYRLNAATFRLPALRERTDRLEIVKQVLAEEAALFKCEPPEFSSRALAFVNAYPWPGNIRQLRNVMRFAVAICDGSTIDLADFPSDVIQSPLPDDASAECLSADQGSPAPTDAAARHLLERDRMIAVLRGHGWHVSAAAKALHVARATFYRRMKRYNIVPPNRADAERG